jgi:hypothetical protein
MMILIVVQNEATQHTHARRGTTKGREIYLESPRKSLETTSSSVYPRMPLSGPSDAYLDLKITILTQLLPLNYNQQTIKALHSGPTPNQNSEKYVKIKTSRFT